MTRMAIVRRLHTFLGTIVLLLITVWPALALEDDPLAESVLVPGWFALILVGLAILLIVIFAALARRGTH